MSKDTVADKAALGETEVAASRARREALHVAADNLIAGVTALESDLDLERFGATLREVLDIVHQHVDEVEAADGLLEEMTLVAARVAFRVERLRREHVELLEKTRSLLDRAEQRDSPGTLATDGRSLAEQLTVHRHRGTALMQDVYLIDISAAD